MPHCLPWRNINLSRTPHPGDPLSYLPALDILPHFNALYDQAISFTANFSPLREGGVRQGEGRQGTRPWSSCFCLPAHSLVNQHPAHTFNPSQISHASPAASLHPSSSNPASHKLLPSITSIFCLQIIWHIKWGPKLEKFVA